VELTYAFEDKCSLYLAMTLMDSGDLRFHIKASKTLDPKRAQFYTAQIVLGLQDLHEKRILFRYAS